ncbi:MAG: hypothetical protein HY286_20015 [Planctomycetes bacterium]|nr:hypothetical protein [Planctomycetota bacterium]
MPSDNQDFQNFRRSRDIKNLEGRLRNRMEIARDEIAKQIACSEAAEEIERRVMNEMREFFTEASRLAAQVLAEIHRRRTEALDSRIEEEIDTFFEDTKQHAMRTLDEIRRAAAAEAPKE